MPLRVAQSPPWNHSIFLVDQEAPKIRTFTGNPPKKNGGGGGVVFFFPPKNITHTHTNKKVNLRIIILHFFWKVSPRRNTVWWVHLHLSWIWWAAGHFFQNEFCFFVDPKEVTSWRTELYNTLHTWLVVSRICYVHPYLGKWSNFE